MRLEQQDCNGFVDIQDVFHYPFNFISNLRTEFCVTDYPNPLLQSTIRSNQNIISSCCSATAAMQSEPLLYLHDRHIYKRACAFQLSMRSSLCATCSFLHALVVAGAVPLWHVWWPRVGAPRLVRSGASVGCPDAVVPFPSPGACAPGFTERLRRVRGGRPRTGLFVPARGRCRGSGSGLAPRRTRSGPRNGVVPGGTLRHRSWAACAAVVCVCEPGH